jgi:heavy metal translocating P-type ATPase
MDFKHVFWRPGAILALLVVGLFHIPFILFLAVLAGIFLIVFESYHEVRQGRFSLDYIAFVAMVVSLVSGQYLAGAVVALMFSGGKALELFASGKAHATLKALADTIPKNALTFREGTYVEIALQDIHEGEKILVKKDEIIPLDGTIASSQGGLFDFSNLTGEVEPISIKENTLVKSGAVNIGESVELRVIGNFSSSTYHKIVSLVEDAKAHPARIVRMSEKANIYFTIVTFVFAVVAYFFNGELGRVLAVLVIATPCPLIIAAPVAFIGGMSRLARSSIIMRKPAAFEDICRADTVFFDKTGTLTMGEPSLSSIEFVRDVPGNSSFLQSDDDALRVAAGIEIHSLHPLARAIVSEARRRKLVFPIATKITEIVGQGISGNVYGRTYAIAGTSKVMQGIALVLRSEGKDVAVFNFSDTLKKGAGRLIAALKDQGIRTEIITGDKKENAAHVFDGLDVVVHAETSPEDKFEIIEEAHAEGRIVAMVGDGLNDAPALARANVGIVFSGTENSASVEAADVVILDHRIVKLAELFDASHRTVAIARQSIYGGIALSCVGMVFAALGYVPPVEGAIIQEIIDVVVILNALRTLQK